MATLKAKQYPYYTVYKYEVDYTDLNNVAATIDQFLLFNFPQRHNIAFAKIQINTRFLGGAINSGFMYLKPDLAGVIAPLTTSRIVDADAYTAPVNFSGGFRYTNQLVSTIGGSSRNYQGSQTVANGVWVQLQVTGANVTALTQGAATIWVGTIPTF